MLILAVLLLLLGLFTAVKILFWIGLVLIVVGLVLNFGPPLSGPVDGPRRRYW